MSLYREKSEHWLRKIKHWQTWKSYLCDFGSKNWYFFFIAKEKSGLGAVQYEMQSNTVKTCLSLHSRSVENHWKVRAVIKNLVEPHAGEKVEIIFWAKKRQPSRKRCPIECHQQMGSKDALERLEERHRQTVLYILMREDWALLSDLC